MEDEVPLDKGQRCIRYLVVIFLERFGEAVSRGDS